MLERLCDLQKCAPTTIRRTPTARSVDKPCLDLIDQADSRKPSIGKPMATSPALTTSLQDKLAETSRLAPPSTWRPGVEIDSAPRTAPLSVIGSVDHCPATLRPERQPRSPARQGMAPGERYGAGHPRRWGTSPSKAVLSDGFAKETLVVIPTEPGTYTPLDTRRRYQRLYPMSENPGRRCPVLHDCPGYGLNNNVYVDQDWTIPNDAFYQNVYGVLVRLTGQFITPARRSRQVHNCSPAMESVSKSELRCLSVRKSYIPGLADRSAARRRAVEPMLRLGTMSASIRLVGGADLAAADSASCGLPPA